MPLVKYFWKMRKMMMIGTAASAAPAMIRPKSVLFSACSFAMPSEMVRLLVLDTADKKTLPILIAQLRSADFLKFDMGKVYMMVAIAILPVIIVYLLLSKFIVRGVALGGVKG